MTPAEFLRDMHAAREAAKVYAEAFDRLAEVQQVEQLSGHDLTARKFAHRAEIARRAYVAEINDPEPAVR
jgi:hypothetical protein